MSNGQGNMKKIIRRIIAWFSLRNKMEMDPLAKKNLNIELETEKYRHSIRNTMRFL